MENTIHISFGYQAGLADRNNLLIEQEEWIANTGFVTKAVFFRYMYSLLMGIAGSVSPMDCGISTENTIASNIHVYPSSPTLGYSLQTTYGELSARRIQEYTQEEVINFSISNSARLKYPLAGDIIYEWIGNVYDYSGNLIPPPSVSINGDELLLSDKVYGSLSLSYPVVRHGYTLVAEARTTGTQDLFGAVVYAPYSGGISWLEISNPPYADELALGATCGGVTIGDTTGGGVGESDPPQFCDQLEIEETYDYCSLDLTGVTRRYV